MARVSVLMPVYNGEKYISDAIESVLKQTYTDFEFIIVNDCSTDNTENIIKEYSDDRIKLITNEKNSGVAKSLNNAVKYCNGEYIARMDADDISLPERFEKQVRFLDDDQNIGVVACNTMTFCGDKIINEKGWSNTEPDKIKVDLLFACAIAHPSVMIRKSALENVGVYDEEYNGIEDYELWCRISEKYGIACLPDVLFKYRIHEAQVSRIVSADIRSKLASLKRRQLSRLGAELSDSEFEAFCSYSMGEYKIDIENISVLDNVFYKIVCANKKSSVYDQRCLSSVLKGIIVGTSSGFEKRDAQRLISQSRLVTNGDYSMYKLKKKIKSLLKRG